jgi:glycosyltransferase involved in cell wall biosynthesis
MNKTICLGMIVKNEKLNIKQTLETVIPIIDYWVIIDTGSTDDTMQIIKETLKDIPGELFERPWINFGYNRSEVALLTKNKADYSLMLDADFLIELDNFNKNDLIDDQYDLLIKWFGTGFYNPLLFNNRLSWKSVGVVHEYWYAEGIKTRSKMPQLCINHDRHGPARPKGLCDIKLLEQGIIDEPNNARYHFYLANTYRDVGEYKKAIEIFNKRVAMGGWEEEVFYSKYQIGYCYELLGDINNAKVEYLKAWEYRPSRAEPLYKLAVICRNNNEYNQSYLFSKKGLEIPYPNDIIFVDKPTYNYCLRFEKSIASYWMGKYAEAIEDCKIIDSLDNVSEDVKIQNRKNIKFSEDKLK